VCVSSASTGLCGGCRATGIPTATDTSRGIRHNNSETLHVVRYSRTLAQVPDTYAQAERRIWRFQIGLGVAGAAGAWALAGRPAALGFAVGAAVSAVNFLWLKQAVDAVAITAVEGEGGLSRRRRRRLVLKFAGRYLLIAAAAYAILKHTAWDIRALLAGLFLFVAAILVEICVELWNMNSGSPSS